MNRQARTGAPAPAVRLALLAVMSLLSILLLPASSMAASGGVGVDATPTGGSKDGGAFAKAKLLPNGDAVAPASAPRRVQRAIAYANDINDTKYQWGGGHASFKDDGYDCSGAVSYMLHGARMLKAPMASGSLAGWGKGGKGKWITVYANGGHTYAVVAGLRWDTSGGPGPRWHKDMSSSAGFTVRHKAGY